MKKYLLLFALASMLWASCSKKVVYFSMREFYFPFESFVPGTAYKFVNDKDSNDVNLWGLHTIVDNYDTFLVTNTYNGKGVQLESIAELVGWTGTQLHEYMVYSIDSTGSTHTIPATVEEDSIFKWTYTYNDSSVWSVDYSDQDNEIRMRKTRTFMNDSAEVNVFGQPCKCMEFCDRYEILSLAPDGSRKITKYSTQNFYARGVGLVRYSVSEPGKKKKDYTLIKMKELEEDSDL
jgi:hypothetical protein